MHLTYVKKHKAFLNKNNNKKFDRQYQISNDFGTVLRENGIQIEFKYRKENDI